ncbi:MAG: LOG family protein [Firmicutes bacterium]|nr:LOG family protein [Bacillota bacterium]
MKVCVFGGTNPATNPKWFAVGEEMGKLLVAANYEKVWGGNSHGVLAQIHKEYVEKNAPNTLVMPTAYEKDLETMKTDKVLKTESICERAEAMLAESDVVVVMPGGIGTIFEFWTAVEVRRAEEYDFDIILLNYDDFYQYQLAHYGFIYAQGFTKIGKGGAPYKIDPKDLFTIATTPQDVMTKLKEIEARRKKTKKK